MSKLKCCQPVHGVGLQMWLSRKTPDDSRSRHLHIAARVDGRYEERKAEPLVPDVGYVLVQRLVVRPDEKVMA